MEGLPTSPHGKRLLYHCNGYSCYYFCLFGALLVHFTGVFNLGYIADNYGEFLVASILIGDITSYGWYLYGYLYADEFNGRSSCTGNIIYDFFMGTILYPRFGEVDIKMVAECRWSWTTLMMLTLSCALKQYEVNGTISSQMAFMLLAHWLYSNATAKGEHCIPCTWDMFHENFGWMLNFWNISGVPFLYCFQSLYVLKNQTLISTNYPLALSVFDFLLLLLGYYIFDTANCQKATIKINIRRNTFPQLPWSQLDAPIRYIKTPKGDLLVDGWYAFGRKMQYTGDIMMATSWGLACGFHSLLPYFYALFFTCMIIHRQTRDEVRCSEKYGEYWKIYTKQVPNVFFPSAAFYNWLLTGEHPGGPITSEPVVVEKSVSVASPKAASPKAKAAVKEEESAGPSTPTKTPVKTPAKRGRKSAVKAEQEQVAYSPPVEKTPSKRALAMFALSSERVTRSTKKLK